jgi:hypothetical protein
LKNYILLTDLIGEAFSAGHNIPRQCARLRTALRSGAISALGHRELCDLGKDDCQEPLAHLQLTRIPAHFWRKVPRVVDSRGQGMWCEDDRGIHKSMRWSESDWYEGNFRVADVTEHWRHYLETYRGVRLQEKLARAELSSLATPGRSISRTRSMPTDDEIGALCDELKASGLGGYEIATKISNFPGFEAVQATYVRANVIKGRYRRGRG